MQPAFNEMHMGFEGLKGWFDLSTKTFLKFFQKSLGGKKKASIFALPLANELTKNRD